MVLSQSVFGRRQTLQLMAGFSAGLLLHACSTASSGTASSNSAETTEISIGTVTWIGLTPLFIAQEKGFFTEEGISLNINNFSSNGEAMAGFVAGRLDAMSAVSSEAILVKAQDKDFKVVLVEDNSVGADGVLAKKSIASIADFKGQKVAVDQSGVSYFFLLQILKEAGLTKEDITPVNVDPPGAAAAYQSGNVDIAVTYAPFLQQANEAVPDGRIIYDSAKMPAAIADMYLFDSAFIAANPKAVQGFVNGVFKGLKFLQQNPQEGLAIAAKQLEMEPDALAGDLKGIKLPDPATNLTMLKDSSSNLYLIPTLKELAQFLADQGEIDAVPADLESIFDPQFVEAAQATAKP